MRDGSGGPGSNQWDARNVFVDAMGRLHLRIVFRDGRWTTAEISTTQAFSFGRFEWFVETPSEGLDPNVVLGLFTYPTWDVGPDTTNEIDIELTRWGDVDNLPLHYTVWPVAPGRPHTGVQAPMTLYGTRTTHRFDWFTDGVDFGSYHGFRSDDEHPIATWSFTPEDSKSRVPQVPVPVHLNLWLFRGRAPTDGANVEVVIDRFNHTPL